MHVFWHEKNWPRSNKVISKEMHLWLALSTISDNVVGSEHGSLSENNPVLIINLKSFVQLQKQSIWKTEPEVTCASQGSCLPHQGQVKGKPLVLLRAALAYCTKQMVSGTSELTNVLTTCPIKSSSNSPDITASKRLYCLKCRNCQGHWITVHLCPRVETSCKFSLLPLKLWFRSHLFLPWQMPKKQHVGKALK